MKSKLICLSTLMLTLTACDRLEDLSKQPSVKKLENEIIKDVEEAADEELHKDLDKRKKK